jgi:adenylate cyclase class 2
MTEIELKAWIGDPAALGAKLDAAGHPAGSYDKSDEYWRPRAGSPEAAGLSLGSGVRIRSGERGAASAIVNFKRKETRAEVEVNDEREFAVSDAAAFRELLDRLGLAPWMRKRKVGRAWDCAGVTAELSRVEGLGDFVELEILADSDDEATVAAARGRLLDLLDRLEVPRSAIEARYYTAMLAERAGGSGPDA